MNHIDVVQHWLDEATQKGSFKLSEVAQILNALSGLRAELEDSQKKSELINRLQESQEPTELEKSCKEVKVDEDTKK